MSLEEMLVYTTFVMEFVTSETMLVEFGRFDVCVGHIKAVVAFERARLGTNIAKCLAKVPHRFRPPMIACFVPSLVSAGASFPWGE